MISNTLKKIMSISGGKGERRETQRWLSQELDVDPTVLNRWVNGHNEPLKPMQDKIKALYRCVKETAEFKENVRYKVSVINTLTGQRREVEALYTKELYDKPMFEIGIKNGESFTVIKTPSDAFGILDMQLIEKIKRR